MLNLDTLSLKARVTWSSILTMVLFIPFVGIALEKAFSASLVQSVEAELQVHIYSLLAEFDVDDDNFYMPEDLLNAKLNQVDSGAFALISEAGSIVWFSASYQDKAPTQLTEPPLGQGWFEQVNIQGEHYFWYRYSAAWYANEEDRPYTFHIFQNKSAFDDEVSGFRLTLWKWLISLSLIVVTLQVIYMLNALRPLASMREKIQDVEAGRAQKVEGRYPLELQQVTDNLNKLISAEQKQRTRYKNSMSDLAHSLKTPLAVLHGEAGMTEGSRAQIDQISKTIEYQLKRASSGSNSTWHQGISMAPIFDKIVASMEKIYRDKEIQFQVQDCETLKFYGDESDFFEIAGNLIDNASKACKGKVHISAFDDDSAFGFSVEDDGRGIPEEKRGLLLKRGERLDTYDAGHGIGLSIVKDIVTAYQGKLTIDNSPLGGARFTIAFNKL